MVGLINSFLRILSVVGIEDLDEIVEVFVVASGGQPFLEVTLEAALQYFGRLRR